MALTYTLAGLRTQLDAYDVAFQAGSLSAALLALETAETIRLTLPDNVSVDGGSVTMPNLTWFKEKKTAINEAILLAARANRKRFIRTGVAFTGEGNSGG